MLTVADLTKGAALAAVHGHFAAPGDARVVRVQLAKDGRTAGIWISSVIRCGVPTRRPNVWLVQCDPAAPISLR